MHSEAASQGPRFLREATLTGVDAIELETGAGDFVEVFDFFNLSNSKIEMLKKSNTSAKSPAPVSSSIISTPICLP